MSLEQNINNSIFSLSQLKNIKKQTDYTKDINMYAKEFNDETNYQVNSDKKIQDKLSQFSEKVTIKPKKAREKAKDAIINKQAEYILSEDNNPMRNKMDTNM